MTRTNATQARGAKDARTFSHQCRLCGRIAVTDTMQSPNRHCIVRGYLGSPQICMFYAARELAPGTTIHPDQAQSRKGGAMKAKQPKFRPSLVRIFEEADGWHWNYDNRSGTLDARGPAYPSKAQAMRAARRWFADNAF